MIVNSTRLLVTECFEIYKKYISENLNIKYTKHDFINLNYSTNCYFLIHKTDERINGFLIAFDCVVWAYIDILFVLPKYRNKGTASELLQNLIVRPHSKWKAIELTIDDNIEIKKWCYKNLFELVENKKFKWMFRKI